MQWPSQMFSPVSGTQSRSAVGSAVAIHDYGGQPVIKLSRPPMTTPLQHLTLALLFTLAIWPQEQISISLVCWELGTDCAGGNNAQTPGPGYNLYNYTISMF